MDRNDMAQMLESGTIFETPADVCGLFAVGMRDQGTPASYLFANWKSGGRLDAIETFAKATELVERMEQHSALELWTAAE